MKKLLLIATSWMILSSCAKTVKSPDETSASTQVQVDNSASAANTARISESKPVRTIAQVQYSGRVEDGGYGWILAIDKGTWVAPTNLSPEFQKDGIFVDVTYSYTDKPVPNYKGLDPKYYVDVLSIVQVKGPGGGTSGQQ